MAKDAVACVVGFVELCGADEFCVAWSGANVTKYAIACVVGVVELCGADEFWVAWSGANLAKDADEVLWT